MKINLISDTVTLPSPPMLEAMMRAEVGDDVFSQDPTVNKLQEKAAKMFGMEMGIFCPSGTMTNQIALQLHTGRLDEVICDKLSHVYQYETGGYSYNARAGIKLIEGKFGKITATQIEEAINPDFDWLPKSSLVVLENTTNKGGGNYYTLDEIKPMASLCRKKKIRIHLDGARIFNGLVETGESPREWGQYFDSISICLSKGLGAPVGSLLLGNQSFIKEARRLRKVMGGGMRQVGYLAAAGIYALDNHIERLKEDNLRAKTLGEKLNTLDYVDNVRPVKTNIVIFDVKPPLTSSIFLERLATKSIIAVPFGPMTVRFTTHLNFTDEMLELVLKEL